VIIEATQGAGSLEEVVEIMSRPIPWAPYLPLTADGWTGEFYRKD
jgi:DNA polymerase